jgi:lipoate-protein ligase B
VRAFLLDLGMMPYTSAFKIQERAFIARQEKRLPAIVIVQENPPVFTIGQAGSRANILAGQAELERRGIEVVTVSRGGDVTYHGPGQLIVSPLVYLGDMGLNANQFLHKLEDVTITLLESYGIRAEKDPQHPGAWVKCKAPPAGNGRLRGDEQASTAKIAAVGLAVKSGYTQHGFAINVDLDLSPYQLINPCGVPAMLVTSMVKQLGRPVAVADVKARLAVVIQQTLGLELEPAPVQIVNRLTQT